MSNKIQINVTITCANHQCTETSRGTMDLVNDFEESEGSFRIDSIPSSLRVFNNLQVFNPDWGQVSDRRHTTFTQLGDWLCRKCL